MQSQNERMIPVLFQGKSFNITVIQVYDLTSNAEEAEVEWFYEELLELTQQNGKDQRSLQERDTKGSFHAKMGSIKTEMVWT